MDNNLYLLICSIIPMVAWLPVTGRDSETGDFRINGLHLLVFGAISAVPAIALRLSQPAASTILSYFTAHAFFRGLLIDGLAGTLLPFSVLLVTLGVFGRSWNPKNIAVRSSAVILGYCLLDGFFALGFHAGPMNILDAFIRSLPKLAMAPLWGILLSYATPNRRRLISVIALVIIGSAFNGLAGFLIDLEHSYFALSTTVASLAVMFIIRPESYIDRETRITDSDGDSVKEPDPAENKRKPAHSVFGLMKQGQYEDARIAAERYLERNNDLYLFAWHALLRWISGEKACKLIFLQRYEALGDQTQRRLCSHLDEYLTYHSGEVKSWINRLEAGYYPESRSNALLT